MANAVQGFTYARDEKFDPVKQDKLANAVSTEFMAHQDSLNVLERTKAAVHHAGEVTSPMDIDVSSTANNTIVVWKREGNNGFGIVIDGQLIVIVE